MLSATLAFSLRWPSARPRSPSERQEAIETYAHHDYDQWLDRQAHAHASKLSLKCSQTLAGGYLLSLMYRALGATGSGTTLLCPMLILLRQQRRSHQPTAKPSLRQTRRTSTRHALAAIYHIQRVQEPVDDQLGS